jgi:hypothetical protein
VVQEGRPVRLRVEYSAPAQVTVSSVEILLSTGDIRIEGDRIIGSHQTVYAVNAPAGPIACQWRAKSLFGTDRLQVALFWTGTYQGAAFGSLVTLGYVRIAS